MGVVQIDSVNVLVRSQELPLFARLGPHPRSLIPDATAAGELFEYWVHEASHVPTAHHHLFRWRMASDHKWRAVRELDGRRPGFVDGVLRRLEQEGPLTASDLEPRATRAGTWWDWDDAKVALESLFWTGRVAAVRRPTDFARLYDVAERVLPPEVLARPTPPEADARRELLLLAARHHGVATLADLVDYHRQKVGPCRPLLRELVAEGHLWEVTVDGWEQAAYVHPHAALPRRLEACALLSPFDPVCWSRDRAERLFDFRYRIEIYTPAAQRVHGYYVLPVLHGDRLVGRLDLKADRRAGALCVAGAFAEPWVDGDGRAAVASDLARELWSMAGWLDLERVTVGERGDLALTLGQTVDQYARGR